MKKLSGFGINVVLSNDVSIEKTIQALIDLRVDHIRLEFNLDENIKATEYFCQLCKQNNIEIVGLLVRQVPGSLATLLFPERKYPDIDAIEKDIVSFVEHTVTKYKKYVSIWEVWNEPNTRRFWIKTPSAHGYSLFLEKISAIIQNIDKNASIVFGGISGKDTLDIPFLLKKNFFRDCIDLGSEQFFDIVAFHPYLLDCYFSINSKKVYKKKLEKNIKQIVTYTRNLTNKPLWFNEFGISPDFVRVSPKDIAEIYVWLYKTCQQHNVPLALWQLYDTESSEYEVITPEKHFGLLDTNLNPKDVYKELIPLLQQIHE